MQFCGIKHVHPVVRHPHPHPHPVHPQSFSPAPAETLSAPNADSSSPPHQPLAIVNLLPVCHCDHSGYIMQVEPFNASQRKVFRTLPCCSVSRSFLPVKGGPSFLQWKKYSTVSLHPICFIYSPVGGHAGCFHLLASVNIAAADMDVQIFSESLFLLLLGVYPEVELLNLMVTLYEILGGTSILFYTAATPLYSSANYSFFFQFYRDVIDI